MQLPALEHLAQRLARSDHLFLPDELVESARTHAIGQRTQCVVRRHVAQQVGLRPTAACAHSTTRR